MDWKVSYTCLSAFGYCMYAICSAALFLQLPNAVTVNILVVSSEIFVLFLINDSRLGLKGQTVTDYCVIHTLTCQPFPLDILTVRTKKFFLINSYFNMTNKFYFLSSLCCKREKGQKRQNILKICYTMEFFFIVNSLHKLVINNLQK